MTDFSKIDMHVHVGLVGDKWSHWGHFSEWFRRQIVYKSFLIFGGIKEHEVSDPVLTEKTIEVIDTCGLDKVVCLALDPVFDEKGNRRPDLSNVWVDNEYIIQKLRSVLPDRILLGASVHPFDPRFTERVKDYADKEAVLLKWLPSAQQFDLSDERVGRAMRALATAGRNGGPLPLLLHVGPEYAIPSTDERTSSYDFLSWSWTDRVHNFLRGRNRWFTPKVKKVHENIGAALGEGAIIIFAHAGLPYFSPGFVGKLFEHSDFKTIRDYLGKTYKGQFKGKCYTDLSACCTPVRRTYFRDLAKLPEELVFFGSDFPTPAFELSADPGEMVNDFKAILKGQFYRIIVPQDNLLDVNYRELQVAFPGHPMFTNFSQQIAG